ncbi:hypothetical protein AGDE_16155 [Angomonas deanei]|nr:hypothetical protein AGDE_16155 [Angomonas deanei]|eukprot:EPY17622.1 hypothetical protein AGDE_16155 [Angomonas deanei]
MEGEIVLEGMRAGITGMVAKSYSEEALRALVVTHTTMRRKELYLPPFCNPTTTCPRASPDRTGSPSNSVCPSALSYTTPAV